MGSFSYTSLAGFKQKRRHSKDIHSHIHSNSPMHTPKRKNKTHNSPNMMSSLSCPLPVQCGSGRLSASLEPAPQGFSTSELQAFSPRTVLTEDICRCVQHLRQHFPTTIPFPTTPTITFSCLASAAHQADSWWLGHVETDDVVIADIGGQALDIFLHGPESAHKCSKAFSNNLYNIPFLWRHSLTHPFPFTHAHS